MRCFCALAITLLFSGCVNHNWKVAMSADLKAMPNADYCVAVLKQDPEVSSVSVSVDNGGTIFQRAVGDRGNVWTSIFVSGSGQQFQMVLIDDHGSVSLRLFGSAWSPGREFGDIALVDFMRDVYTRLSKKVAEMPQYSELRCAITNEGGHGGGM
jgi:hypothetical protein